MAFWAHALAQQKELELLAELEIEDHAELTTPDDAQYMTEIIRSKASEILRGRNKIMTRESMDIIIPLDWKPKIAPIFIKSCSIL